MVKFLVRAMSRPAPGSVSSVSSPVPGATPTTATYYQCDAPTAGNALVVLAHGAGAGQHHPFMVGVAEAIAARGIDVATFDFPYVHNRRKLPDRQPTLEACFEQVVSWARAHGEARGRARLFVGGKSMGGRIATHLGARGTAGLAGIVALGYPLRPPGRTGTDRAGHLALVHQPLLVVQGTRDTFGTPADIRDATAATPGPVTIISIEGGDHSFVVRGTPARQVVDGLGDTVASWIGVL
jgi:predicted alpha/beta-hydrolase family hydrolase